MPDVLIRDLDPAVLEQLKEAARENGRSLQTEIHEVLRAAVEMRVAHTRKLSAAWHRRLADRSFEDSAKLIRDDREQ